MSSVGRYERWDPDTREWVHVAEKGGRDYLSRLIENGDGVVPSTPAEIAELP